MASLLDLLGLGPNVAPWFPAGGPSTDVLPAPAPPPVAEATPVQEGPFDRLRAEAAQLPIADIYNRGVGVPPSGKVPSPDFNAPLPGLGPSWRDQFTPGLETAKGLIGGALEPFGQAGRLMTGASQDVPGDLAGVLAAATPMGKLGKLGKLAKPAAEAAEAATGGLGDFIKAYHGSPHDFEKFDLSKIGTGEGAQAYGHGLYFAENEGVAKGYKEALTNRADPTYNFKGDTIPHSDLLRRLQSNFDITGFAARRLLSDIQRGAPLEEMQAIGHSPGIKDAAAWLHKNGASANPMSEGKVYQVAIKANPEHFLDWDKPLSEQPHVQDKLTQLAESGSAPLHKMIKDALSKEYSTGQTIAGIVGTGEDATAALREAGVPGIKYLDQGSRPDEMRIVDRSNITAKPSDEGPFFVHNLGKEVGGPFNEHSSAQKWLEANRPKQTRNFVVFDDKLIDILKKYGIAGIGALPAMNAFHYQENSK